MRKWTIVLLALPLLGAGVAVAQGPSDGPVGQSIPRLIESSQLSQPAWVAADALLTEDGGLSIEDLPTGSALLLQQALEAAQESGADCIELGPTYTDLRQGVVIPHDLDDLTANSLAILRGTVTARGGGFFAGRAGLLLEVEVSETLKRSERFWHGDRVWVYYPVGEFRLGEARICKSDPRWPAPPEVGDPILLFPQAAPYDNAGLTILPDSDGFEVLLEQGDGVFVPQRLANDGRVVGARSLDEIAAAVRQLLARDTAREEVE